MSTRELKWGAYGGLAGGLIFGMLMGMMGMLPMIGSMIGQPTAAAGFAVHMANSVIIGGRLRYCTRPVRERDFQRCGDRPRIRWGLVDPWTAHLDAALNGHGLRR